MVTLDDLFKTLDNLKANNKIVEWKKARDSGDVVIINIGYSTDDDVVIYENFAVRVYNRGKVNENIRWERRKPNQLINKIKSNFETYLQDSRLLIINDLKQNHNVVKIIDFIVNEKYEYVSVRAFVGVQQGQLTEKEFVILFDQNGNYTIYEKV